MVIGLESPSHPVVRVGRHWEIFVDTVVRARPGARNAVVIEAHLSFLLNAQATRLSMTIRSITSSTESLYGWVLGYLGPF